MSDRRPPPTSGISYVFLTVADVGAALSFYTDVLGFEVVVAQDEFAFLALPASPRPQLALYRGDPAASAGRLLAIDVPDLADWQGCLPDAGEIEEVPGGRVLKLSDPDGNQLELHEPDPR